ncbi:hypothetical protein EIP91_002764 [Steccherinum ochraceum]|uniref:FAD/NAD(P)-binding domain-containing protein n=1 Tax=Steccherinum ochraceum TaxID=92696 RepID=A0A4R0RE30_9APHY|nr:hypothetical protein EIP91_002764 [Steccherinum ochraceum]
MASSTFKGDTTPRRVVIIGGGVGGLTAAITVKRQLGFDNFTLYEQSSGVGGVWHHNTYPGAAADIGTHWYSLSSDINPDWDRSHVLQADLLKYWIGLTRKYGVDKNIVVNTSVTKLIWDEAKQLYYVHTQNSETGETSVDYANAVISGVGLLNVPHYPKEMEGAKTKFKGAHFHSARWDHSVDLHNKRVAVIGNGCSGCQLMPFLVQDPTTQVVNYCRSPGWFLPDMRMRIPIVFRWMMKYIPFVKQFARYAVFVQHELIYYALFPFGKTALIKWGLGMYIKSQTPKKYHDKVVPTHPSGCKRFVIDAGYLKSLHKDNFDVNYDGVQEVTETGILTKKGEFKEYDVIVEATGFDTDSYPFEIIGVGGKTIQEYYDEQGGPTAYIGTTAPGFPNFFTLSGPNTITGHGSVVFTTESQLMHITQLLEPVLKGWASSFDVTKKAADKYNTYLHNRLRDSIWSGCASWYRVGSEGRITGVWPGAIWTQWWWLRKVTWSDYKGQGAEQWARRQRYTRLISLVKNACWVLVFLWAGVNWRVLRSLGETGLQKLSTMIA